MLIYIHVAGAFVSLLAGYTALYVRKGGTLHRRSGMLFVYAMMAMCGGGVVLALLHQKRSSSTNALAGTLTAYLVITALTAVRPPRRGGRALHIAALFVVAVVGATDLGFGIDAVVLGGRRNGMPAFPYFLFATIAMLATIGDLRVLRSGAPQGAARLSRHLWRMTSGLLIAALSFFLGRAEMIPKPLRIPGLLALPELAVLVTLFYWLWRIKRRSAAVPAAGSAAPRRRRERDALGPAGEDAGVPPAAVIIGRHA